MVQDNTSPFGTAFTVSIEAARGVTTGISAADRARTIQAAVAPKAKPGDLVRPGHVFPLRARDGRRAGPHRPDRGLGGPRPPRRPLPRGRHLRGDEPGRDDGPAPGAACASPGGTGSTLLSVADLIRYRLQNDRLVKRVAASELRRPQQGTWMAYAYQSDVDSDVHIAW